MLPTLEEFVANTKLRNSYISHPLFLSLYVRKGPCWIQTPTISGVQDRVFQIASVEAARPRTGAFRSLLGELARQIPGWLVLVESVLNAGFVGALPRMGFDRVLGREPPSFVIRL